MVTPHILATESKKALGLTVDLYLKREDLHPLGSHKGRSIPLMIEKAVALGKDKFVISSSGNAAIAALGHLSQTPEISNFEIKVLVGKSIPDEKLSTLKELSSKLPHSSIEQVERPLQQLKKYEQEGYTSLRQSTDDTALIGYKTLGEELLNIPALKHIFLPSSSGTTAQSLLEYFKEKAAKVDVYVAQTTSCHPFYDGVAQTETTPAGEKSIADAIVDMVGHRNKYLKNLFNTKDPVGIITNTEIRDATALLKKDDVEVSPNGALALALLTQKVKTGWQPEGSIAVLICGR